MPNLKILPGPPALSPARQKRKASVIKAETLRALSVYYVESSEALSDDELSVVDQLLARKHHAEGQGDPLTIPLRKHIDGDEPLMDSNANVYYRVPRAGTISPWSSQATSIAQKRGLTNVLRIEHGVAYYIKFAHSPTEDDLRTAKETLHDRMTQQLLPSARHLSFEERPRGSVKTVKLVGSNRQSAEDVLRKANRDQGLALDAGEMQYLLEAYRLRLKRDPTDVELYMFAQVNSEHCRHKQFNATWTIDGLGMERTLFQWIKRTHQHNPRHVISAYSDNAAVFEGASSTYFAPQTLTGVWTQTKEVVHYIGKVETHNHPTGVSPYPGAATGSGGEIRDEGAVGRGSKPKAGLSGYCVSDLLIPGHRQPWELDIGKPSHIASSLQIMTDAPLGSADYNNEFGRPALITDFFTFSMDVPVEGDRNNTRGYHKPIMVAGGVGTVRPHLAQKQKALVKAGDVLLVLGGPAMLIGLGGGAASSIQSGEGNEQLDFASVQRGNAEVQRRAQEVINACADETSNPISSIHDVGAGGLSNALTELVHDSGLGGDFELRDIDNADKSMSPREIWCCEAQERYVLVVPEDKLARFKSIAKRERCGYSIVGRATGKKDSPDNRLVVTDRDPAPTDGSAEAASRPIDLDMGTLFGKAPQLTRIVSTRKPHLQHFDSSLKEYVPEEPFPIAEAVKRVTHLPAASSRSFMITIGDRTVGGLTARDQMVGPWQTPVADVAVTATTLQKGIKTGEAMATGMRPSIALISPGASVRMAVADCLIKLCAGDLSDRLNRVHLSANWMAACNHDGEGPALYEAVQSVSEFCQRMRICIPVGKDSMSMKMGWKDPQSKENKEVTAPLTLYVTAFGLVRDIGNTFTPTLRRQEDVAETLILFVDLSIDDETAAGRRGQKAMGGSGLAQTFKRLGNKAPDVRDESLLKDFIDAMDQLHEAGIVLAYHTRSVGGLFRTLTEMMYAGRCGLEIGLDDIAMNVSTGESIASLFNEELGAVFQIRKRDETNFKRCFANCGPPDGLIKRIGRVPPTSNQKLTILHGTRVLYSADRADLQQSWTSTSHAIARLRDDPACADAEHAAIRHSTDPGLSYKLTFSPAEDVAARSWKATLSIAFTGSVPKVAILREQGVNGQAEMAFAFREAGFVAKDVHMTDLESGRESLAGYVGLAACGGFSYGDVLGAGRGWATGVLMNPLVRGEFKAFFERPDTFTLGVCNGCQFLSHIKEIIPGAEDWPTFEGNASERYEARVCMVGVEDGQGKAGGVAPSVFLHGMHGSTFPVATAHAEGRAVFAEGTSAEGMLERGLVPLRYTDNYRNPTESYPLNPNGSALGIAAVRTPDGRCLAMMPHPERSIIKECASWLPDEAGEWGEFGPWMRMFRSARRWVG